MKTLFAGLEGDTLCITRVAAGLTGAYLDFFCTAMVVFGVIGTLLYAAFNALNGVVCFHHGYQSFLLIIEE